MEAVNDSLSMCAMPALIPHAYHLGGLVSSLSYSLPPQALQPKWVCHLIAAPLHTINTHTCTHYFKYNIFKSKDYFTMSTISRWTLYLCQSQPSRWYLSLSALQATLLSRCQDPVSRGTAVFCCYQRRALSPCFIPVQGQDQILCRQTERDLQPGEVQRWEVALGQWTA